MKVLALSPHTDDIEFACGASINKWIKEGATVYVVSFTAASAQSKEFYEATKRLGVQGTRLLNYLVRNFPQNRQRILGELVALERELSPDLVLIPSTSDTHQDHQVIREEGFRAFKRHSLLGYEMPQNNLSFSTNLFVRIDRDDLMAKCEALSCYKSQSNRPYITKEFIEGLARVRGMQAGCEFAESYEVMRWML